MTKQSLLTLWPALRASLAEEARHPENYKFGSFHLATVLGTSAVPVHEIQHEDGLGLGDVDDWLMHVPPEVSDRIILNIFDELLHYSRSPRDLAMIGAAEVTSSPDLKRFASAADGQLLRAKQYP